jgi:hypothetical protein
MGVLEENKGVTHDTSAAPINIQVAILLSNSQLFGSVYDYDWNPLDTTTIARALDFAQKKDSGSTERPAQRAVNAHCELRNRTLYRRGNQHNKESYVEMGVARLDSAPSTLVLEQKNKKDAKRFEYLIFKQGTSNHYVKYTELKAIFSIEVERQRFEKHRSVLIPEANTNNNNNAHDIHEEPTEEGYLRSIFQTYQSADNPKEFDDFLKHLQDNKNTALTEEQNQQISPLYLCYIRRKIQIQAEIDDLELNKNKDKNNKLAKKIFAAAAAKKNEQTLDDTPLLAEENSQSNNSGARPISANPQAQGRRRFFQIANRFMRPVSPEDRLAVLQLELANYATYENFLNKIERSLALDNDDEFEAYGQFIEEEVKKLNLTHYGWGSEEDHIAHLRPNNKTAFIDAALKSAPEVSILTLIAKAVPEASVTLSFGIAANVLLVPLFFYNFHQSVETAKYQKNNQGRKPDEFGLDPIYDKIQKDSRVLGAQTFTAALMGTFVMNKGLHEAIGFNPLESLINGISPGSLIPGELSSGLTSAALQALPWWVNLTVGALCGTVVGLTMMAVTLASTRKDEEFSWGHVGASFALGFAAGSLMYGATVCNLGDNRAVSDVFGLAINGLLGLGLHWAMPKSRYQTLNQKEAAATGKKLSFTDKAPMTSLIPEEPAAQGIFSSNQQ